MRRDHYIKAPSKAYIPHNLLFYDVESFVHKIDAQTEFHTFRLATAIFVRINNDINVEEEIRFICHTQQELADVICNLAYKYKTLEAIAHNANYDVQVSELIKHLTQRGFEIRHIYVKNAVFIVSLANKKCRIFLTDGLNRLRGDIRSLGKLVGLEKLSVDFDHVADEELLTYCIRDVEILKEATLQYFKFVLSLGVNRIAKTVSSQAFVIYKQKFMKHKIHVHTNECALEIEKNSYKGGLVKAFKYGMFNNSTYYQLDVNSMYPSVLKDFDYPTKLIAIIENPTLERIKTLMKHGLLIGEFTIKPSLPFFPIEYGNTKIYPTCEFKTTLTTPEIQFLLERNEIVSCHRVCVYKKRTLFEDFVNSMYSLRLKFKQEGNKCYDLLTKLILNSLYGKFGATSSGYERDSDYDFLPAQNGKILIKPSKRWKNYIKIDGKAYIENASDVCYDSFIAIASHVTAYARMRLAKIILQAGIENVFYCDTDSIIVSQNGFENVKDLVDESKLGYLKIEHVSDSICILGRKFYSIGNKVKRKGVSRKLLEKDNTSKTKETWQGFAPYLKSNFTIPYKVSKNNLMFKFPMYDVTIDKHGNFIPYSNIPKKIPSLIDVLPSSVPSYLLPETYKEKPMSPGGE